MAKLIELEWSDVQHDNPYADCSDLDKKFGIEFDGTNCAQGDNCCSFTDKRPYAAPVGPGLDVDPETDMDRGTWRTCFYYEDDPTRLFCEDCANEMPDED